MKKILIAVFAIGLLAVISGCASEEVSSGVSEGNVAVVEEVPGDAGEISLDDYERAFKQSWMLAGLKKAPKETDSVFEQVKETAINQLIERAWVFGEAAERGITVDNSELRPALKQEFPTEAEYEKFLEEKQGFDDQLRFQILDSKLQSEFTQVEVKVTPEEVKEFYNKSKDQFAQGKEVSSFSEIKDQVRNRLVLKRKQQKLNTLIEEFNQKWTERTICAEGYITERCSDWVGPEEGEPNPGIE